MRDLVGRQRAGLDDFVPATVDYPETEGVTGLVVPVVESEFAGFLSRVDMLEPLLVDFQVVQHSSCNPF